MSELQIEGKRVKTKQQYSRNVKKLKIKFANLQKQIMTFERKIQTLSNTSNDKIIAMKIAKFCKERHFTPEMIFRFADKMNKGSVGKIQFGQTLQKIGLKLSKDEFLRLEYLIDEDLSGEISFNQYNGYLSAFGIKKQFNANDLLVKDALAKIDLDKILKISEENISDNRGKDKKKHANLLNYEQFIKYCHKHFPDLKNKELASIFNRLERNGLINLQDLIDYLNGIQAQRKRLEQKNKKNQKKEGNIKNDENKSKDQDIKSLKGIIKAIFKYRHKSGTIVFHSSEFVRLQKILNKRRGELMNLFKEIDSKRKGICKGSFGMNELINYFIDKQRSGKDLAYTFELMGKKIILQNQKPQAILSQYSSKADFISNQEIQRLMALQYEISKNDYQILLKLIPRQIDQTVAFQTLIDLMNINDKKRLIFIKPNNSPNLILRSGVQALRYCLQIEQKLAKAKLLYWNDYQFGPTQSDQQGLESINLALPSETVAWEMVNQLGMMQFYKSKCTEESTYECSPISPHEIFAKSLHSLLSANEQILQWKQPINDKIQKVEQQHLNPLFYGLYPLVFRYFAKYGIYVFKFFHNEKWRYVIIDHKIPCTSDQSPFFSTTKNKKYSYISLIEKAYAKLYGNYKNLFDVQCTVKYLKELSNLLPVETKISKNFSEEKKNEIWEILRNNKIDAKNKISGKNDITKQRKMYCLNQSERKNTIKSQIVDKGIISDYIYPISATTEVKDQQSKNPHKSHRLLLIKMMSSTKNQKKWNSNWNREEQHNKYSTFQKQIMFQMAKSELLMDSSQLLLNYKLFRQNFTSLIQYKSIDFENMIILRKELQFQEKFKCRYEIKSKYDFSFVLVLNKFKGPQNTKIYLDLSNETKKIKSQQILNDSFMIHEIRLQKNQEYVMQLSVGNWQAGNIYLYNLTLYMAHPRYEMKERDRHLLFRYVSPYEQEPKIAFGDFDDTQKLFIYRQFYKAAERRGCCGCL